MPSTTLYPLASLFYFQATAQTWQKYLPDSHFSLLELMPALPISSTQYGWWTMKHALHLADHAATSPSSIGVYHHHQKLPLTQFTSGQRTLSYLSWHLNCAASSDSLSHSKPCAPALTQQNHLCPWASSVGDCLGKTSDRQPASTHLAKQLDIRDKSGPMVPGPLTRPKWWPGWYDRLRQWHPCCLWNLPTLWTSCPTARILFNLLELWSSHILHAMPINWYLGTYGCLIQTFLSFMCYFVCFFYL